MRASARAEHASPVVVLSGEEEPELGPEPEPVFADSRTQNYGRT